MRRTNRIGQPVSVVVLMAGNERGGAATHLLTLARHASGSSVSFEFVFFGDGVLVQRFAEEGHCHTLWSGTLQQNVRSLAAYLKSKPGVILHSHGPRMNVLAARVAKKARCAWTSTIHSNPRLDFLSSRWKSAVLVPLHLHSLRSSVGVFVVSKAFADLLPVRTVAFVPNSVEITPPSKPVSECRRDLRRALNLPLETVLLGTAARFDPVKNIPTLLRAVAHMVRSDVHLVIAGDGPLRGEYENLAESLNIRSRVHFLGFLDQVSNFYAALDAHVLVSRSEGTPFSVLEAGGLGVPTVGSDIPGIRNLLDDGRTGRLVTVNDSRALADVLDEVATDAGLRARLVKEFQATVLPKFTPKKMLQAYARGYDLFAGLSPAVRTRSENKWSDRW
ncbi:MAG: glycosyltransferase family 4 protein [Alicyclobacillaceae bacterium]|nr:glycosyltransferase family 4 protein [Alicyclobacillaceae bacterium]MCY0894672.1 glycosyltransferase family 4 protein [Alicyclobacillaceae bacterium]